MRRAATTVSLALLLAGSVWAGNPISVESSGALRWDTTSAITWNPDAGNLGTWDNTTAIARVTNAFAQWQTIPTANISYAAGAAIVDGGGTPVDVTSANYDAIILLDNGQNPIIFDNDRDIYDHLGTPNNVLGFAGILRTDGMGTITKGWGVLQGDWFDGDPNDVGEVSALQFRGVFVHEFGHFSGLGHSTVNRHLSSGIGACPLPTKINYTTMHPISHDESLTPHNDDRSILSRLYPEPTWLSNFGAISGTVRNIDGTTPFDGANVILRPDTTDCTDIYELAQAMQSGVNPGDDGAGGYVFQGLAVPDDWTVYVTSVTGGGSYPIGGSFPPVLPAPDEFYNGANESTTNPPDDPAAVTAIAVTTAGSTVGGTDVLLNSVDGPGAVDDASLLVDKFDGNTPGPPEPLQLDDGGVESVFGFGGTTQLAWISRFTPAPSQLPYQLERIDIRFDDTGTVLIGDPIRLLIYTDTGGTGTPVNSTLTATADTTVAGFGAFTEYVVDPPVVISSGDFYIGAFELSGSSDTLPASSDTHTQGGTSWVNGGSTDPSGFLEITTLGMPGPPDQTWMIRAYGSPFPPAGTIRLGWNDSCNLGSVPGQDYAVYQGTVASLSGTQDHAPIICGTGEKNYALPAPGGIVFWLVSPLLATQEGGQGAGTSTPRVPTSSCQTVSPGFCP